MSEPPKKKKKRIKTAPKKKVSKSLVDNLLIRPKKDEGGNKPHYRNYKAGLVWEADLLFLPNDEGYRYVLVVVDIGSHLVDAEPLKQRNAPQTVEAMKKIWKRNILKHPKYRIDTDGGKEFKGAFITWRRSKGLDTRVGLPDRHRQQAIVETKNQPITFPIFENQLQRELLTGYRGDTEWVDDLPSIISKINTKTRNHFRPRKEKDVPTCKKGTKSCEVLPQGTRVRRILDRPERAVEGDKIGNKFRITDTRWKNKIQIIKESIVQADQPPLYLLNNDDGSTDRSVAYTRNQLQVVPENEQKQVMPKKEEKPVIEDASVPKPIKDEQGTEKYVIEKLIKKVKKGNRVFYVVKWKGYKETTEEPRSVLMKDVPKLVRAFEKKNKKKKGKAEAVVNKKQNKATKSVPPSSGSSRSKGFTPVQVPEAQQEAIEQQIRSTRRGRKVNKPARFRD